MVLGVDGTIVGDFIDLLTLGANLGDGVGGDFLELLDDAVHDIDEDNLSWSMSLCLQRRERVCVREREREGLPHIQSNVASQQRSHVQCFRRQNELP